MQFLTYADLLEHALDFLGGTSDAQAERDCRRAVQQAYRDLVNARTWSYLYRHGRVLTDAPSIAGTIAYDAATRRVLLYGGTWPAWAGPGAEVRIGVVTSMVIERASDTVLVLDAQVNPGVDLDLDRHAITGVSRTAPIVLTVPGHGLATGATVIVEGVLGYQGGSVSADGTWTITRVDVDHFSLVGSDGSGDVAWDGIHGTWRLPPTTPYTLYHDTYLLPDDFIKSDTAIYEGNFGGLTYSDPTDELWWQRFTKSAGTPRFYTLRGTSFWPGRLAISFFPYPDQQKTIDYIYERRARELRLASSSAGTVTVAAGSTAVVGNGTAFDPSWEGAVFRIGTARTSPTSWVGVAPPSFETTIAAVLGPTALRLAGPVPATVSGWPYVVSDPADIEIFSMSNALLRGIEKALSVARSLAQKADAVALYDRALKEAQAADSRSYQGRSMGARGGRWINPKYMPANFFPRS